MTSSRLAGGAATVSGLLLRSAQRWPDADALVEGQTVLTHGQAWARAQTVAARLAARGVRPGDRIGLFMPNGWRYAVAYYGVQLAGAVAVLVNTRFTAPEIDYVLTDSGTDFVIVDAGLASRVPQTCTHWDVDELTAPGPPDGVVAGLAAASTDVANILYTSGTTGYPKGAMQTQGNLVFNAGTVGSMFRVSPDDRTLVVAPMFHATGRMKDMIIRGGENIYSLEVESVISRHPAVAEVAVVGVPDGVFGERVRAVAVLREGASLPIAALREWAGTQLADYKLPTELITVDELPRNASAKVIKKQLAALLTKTPPASASR